MISKNSLGNRVLFIYRKLTSITVLIDNLIIRYPRYYHSQSVSLTSTAESMVCLTETTETRMTEDENGGACSVFGRSSALT